MGACKNCGGECLTPHTVDVVDVFAPCPLCHEKKNVGWDGADGITCGQCGIHLPARNNDEETLEAWNRRGFLRWSR